MVLPLLLFFLAASASAIVAYGTHPAWAQYAHGLGVILFTRRFEWPMAAVAILLCLAVVGLVVAGKRRAWWLIGLGPILALFVHRYETDPMRRFAILDGPSFVPAAQAWFLADNDYVVGLTFEGSAYAYPYFALYAAPVVSQAEHDKRMLLMWNAYANRAMAFQINHELYARDLEIVSMPANAMLLYNGKLGQFINGVTGLTPQSQKPKGFSSPIQVQKVIWREWMESHPATRVMVPPAGASPAKIPSSPLRPIKKDSSGDTLIAMICTTRPVAVLLQGVPEKPASIVVGGVPVLIFRDRATKRLLVFDRRVEDLTLKFKPNTDARRKLVVWIDQDTDSGWTADGRAVDGPLGKAGKHLASIPVDEGLWWGVMKKWVPDLEMLDPIPVPPEVRPPTRTPTVRTPTRSPTRRPGR